MIITPELEKIYRLYETGQLSYEQMRTEIKEYIDRRCHG